MAATALPALVPGSAVAGLAGGQYVVKSITLTYATSVTTTGAIDAKGSSGTLKTTLTATLNGTTTGGPVGLAKPEVLSEYLCSPTCPGFKAGGTVKIVETFAPAGGQPVHCTSTKNLPVGAQGQVYLQGSATSKKVVTIKLIQAATANALYLAARNKACKTPSSQPIDSYDYSGFGSVSIPVSAIGGQTITAKLHNNLKPATYPWPATGTNAVTAAVTLSRKS